MKGFYSSTIVGISAAAVALVLSASQVRAITVDGSLDGAYGSALSVQTMNTQFGDSSYTGSPNGPDANGSEIDAAYGVIQGGNLYVFLSGNFENNGNHVNVFIDTGAPGQSVLNVGPSTESAMNGSVFSPGFQAVYMVDANDYQGTVYVDQVDLTVPVGVQSYLGAVGLTAGVGNGAVGALTLGLDNSNTAGVDGSGPSAANPVAAAAVTTGMELCIPLSTIGNPGGAIYVLADINGGGDGYLSNQFAPGLPAGTGNLGGGGPYTGPGSGAFNFGSTPGEYFIVVPEPSTIALVIVGLLGALAVRRRKV